MDYFQLGEQIGEVIIPLLFIFLGYLLYKLLFKKEKEKKKKNNQTSTIH
jgi:uncharacterized membrane protein YhdT